jgi:hypothetical protein
MKMEQILACLLTKMNAMWGEMGSNQERMYAKIGAEIKAI